MKRNIINLKYDQLSDLLIESKKNQDLTILCKNGRFTCNGFLFVTIFPDLSESLNLVSICEETPTISIPDSYLSDFQDFFNCLYERLPKLKPSKFLQTLLQWPKVSVTSSDIKIDTLKYESLKGRFLDDVNRRSKKTVTQKQIGLKISMMNGKMNALSCQKKTLSLSKYK